MLLKTQRRSWPRVAAPGLESARPILLPRNDQASVSRGRARVVTAMKRKRDSGSSDSAFAEREDHGSEHEPTSYSDAGSL